MKTCACGASNADDAKFCSQCGKALGAAKPAATRSQARPKIEAAAEKARQAEGWRPGHVLEPVTSKVRAVTLVQAGVLVAGISAAVAVMFGLMLLNIDKGLAVQELGIGVMLGIAAFFMLRGSSLAAAAVLALFGYDIFANLIGNGGVEHVRSSGGIVWGVAFLRWVVAPYVVLGAFRGALAWERFKREEQTAGQ